MLCSAVCYVVRLIPPPRLRQSYTKVIFTTAKSTTILEAKNSDSYQRVVTRTTENRRTTSMLVE
jgi:hypothetical protein